MSDRAYLRIRSDGTSQPHIATNVLHRGPIRACGQLQDIHQDDMTAVGHNRSKE